jgi:AcrR family transcriptional regulator
LRRERQDITIARGLWSLMSKPNETSVAPRRVAQQKRSALKIKKILDTTLSLLSAGTADKITTNAIAKAAGISIGSLYQFFPNKEAIL